MAWTVGPLIARRQCRDLVRLQVAFIQRVEKSEHTYSTGRPALSQKKGTLCWPRKLNDNILGAKKVKSLLIFKTKINSLLQSCAVHLNTLLGLQRESWHFWRGDPQIAVALKKRKTPGRATPRSRAIEVG